VTDLKTEMARRSVPAPLVA